MFSVGCVRLLILSRDTSGESATLDAKTPSGISDKPQSQIKMSLMKYAAHFGFYISANVF